MYTPSAGGPDRVSAVVPDWSREEARSWWDPSRRLLKSIRDYQRWRGRSGFVRQILCRLCVLRHGFWTAITGAQIPLSCRLGGGLLIPHPNGIVISPDATLGPNCLVFQQVTIGTNGTYSGAPTIGGHVDIGAGAKLLGDVHISDHAKIGANAVVLCDVPEGATAGRKSPAAQIVPRARPAQNRPPPGARPGVIAPWPRGNGV